MTKLVNIENADFSLFEKRDYLLDELISKQLDDVPSEYKLSRKDLFRITKYIDKSIFSNDGCVLWQGYVKKLTTRKNPGEVCFFYKGKKKILHRLLFRNFFKLEDYQYIKAECNHQGQCVNLNHYKIYNYNNNTKIFQRKRDKQTQTEEIKNIDDDINLKLTLII